MAGRYTFINRYRREGAKQGIKLFSHLEENLRNIFLSDVSSADCQIEQVKQSKAIKVIYIYVGNNQMKQTRKCDNVWIRIRQQKQGGIKGELQQRKCRINTQLLHPYTRAQAKHAHTRRHADWSNNRTYFVLHMSTRAGECTKSASRLVGVGMAGRGTQREKELRPSKSKAKANDRKSTGAAM